MFKFVLGAAFVVALVGYGVITTEDVGNYGDRLVNGVNAVAKEVEQATR